MSSSQTEQLEQKNAYLKSQIQALKVENGNLRKVMDWMAEQLRESVKELKKYDPSIF